MIALLSNYKLRRKKNFNWTNKDSSYGAQCNAGTQDWAVYRI